MQAGSVIFTIMTGPIRLLKLPIIAIVAMLLMVHKSHAQNADADMLRRICLQRSDSRDKVLAAISASVYPVSIAVPLTELVAGYAADNKRMRIAGWQSVGGLAINTLLVTGLKYSINRDRPYKTHPDIIAYKQENDPSFPSGHTAYAFCTATSLTISFPKWYVAAPAYTYAAVAGYSRLALGEHYPSDVLVGAVVGCGSAWLSWKGNQWLQKRNHVSEP